jgi:photosystem II stability/assembly factor-like uncharacterized protein
MSQWIPTSLTGGDVLSLAVADEGLYVAVDEPDGTAIHRSVDGGAYWHPLPARPLPGITALCATSAGVVVGTAADGPYRFHGGAWVPLGDRPETVAISALAVTDDYLFAATRGAGVLRSSHAGSTWQSVSPGLPLDGRGLDVVALEYWRGLLFAGHSFGLHRSADLGRTWIPVTPSIPASVHPMLLGAGGPGVFVRASGLYRSSDGGDSWLRMASENRPPFFVRHVAVWNDRVFVGTIGDADAGVFGSSDGGQTWVPIGSGLPPSWSVFVAGWADTLFAGPSGGGLWRCHPDMPAPTSDGTPAFDGPECRPNPCDDRARITFTLDADAHVRLEIRSMLDEQLLSLVDDVRPAGRHDVELDARFLPGGIYHCRLTVAHTSMNRRLVVLRAA